MTTKVVKAAQQIFVSLLLIIGIIACEGDIKEVGVNIVDNELFKSDSYSSDVIAYNQNVDRRIANGLGQYLLGVYSNEDFGRIEGTIVSQLTYNTVIDFGVDPVIDTVIINIPYYSTEVGTYSNGSPKFELDSVYGLNIDSQENNLTHPFNLKVFELETFLNSLDPEDPTQPLTYYTDDNYTYFSDAFFEGLFVPNPKDTVLYVKRPEIIEDEANEIYNIDTVKYVDSKPTLKIPLKEDYFTANFLDNPDIFESLDVFIEFFRGLYIEASPGTNSEAAISSLDLGSAAMTIYYTNTVSSINDDNETVEVRTKQSANFLFSGVSNSKYTRDYSGSNAEPILNNPDVVDGDEQLFVQGAAGSIALVELFVNDDIEELRDQNLLITDASLVFYVDQSSELSIAPYRMFLYNYETSHQLPDLLFEGLTSFDGTLEKDGSDDPYRYKLNITDYISRILASEDAIEPSTLALKVMNVTDIPDGVTDIDVDDYNWTPLGITLHGNQSADEDKQPKLIISYSEINTNN